MLSTKSIRAGILIVVATAGTLSCGETEFTEPNPSSEIVAVQGWEQFLNSPQQESRELLIDGRVTDIEWNVTGDPSIILMDGVSGSGGSYYVSVRSLWTLDRFGAPDGILFLLQWPDPTEDRFEQPFVTSADVVSDAGDTLNCSTDDTLVHARVHDNDAVYGPHRWQTIEVRWDGGAMPMRWYGEFLFDARVPFEAGVTGVEVCAVDAAGNEACVPGG